MESTDEVHGGVDSVQEIHQYVDVGGHVDDDEKPQTPPGDFEKLKLMSEQVSAGSGQERKGLQRDNSEN